MSVPPAARPQLLTVVTLSRDFDWSARMSDVFETWRDQTIAP